VHLGELGLQRLVLDDEALSLEDAVDARQHFAALGGLVMSRTRPRAWPRPRFRPCRRRYQDDVDLGCTVFAARKRAWPSIARHHEIGEHHVHGLVAQHLERFFAVVGREHLVAGALEDSPKAVAVAGLIVDDENTGMVAMLHARDAHGTKRAWG